MVQNDSRKFRLNRMEILRKTKKNQKVTIFCPFLGKFWLAMFLKSQPYDIDAIAHIGI